MWLRTNKTFNASHLMSGVFFVVRKFTQENKALNPKASTFAAKLMAGFTLIEMLVVLVFLALFSSMVIISIGDNFEREMRAEAERLQGLLMATSDEAVYSSSEFGFYLSNKGYVVLRYDSLANGWSPLNKKPFLPHELPEGMKMHWSIEGFASPINDEDTGAGNISDFGFTAEDQDSDNIFDPQSDSFGEQEKNSNILNLQPQIFTLSSGEVTVFSITLSAIDLAAQRGEFIISSDGFSMPRIKKVMAK